MKYNYEWNLKDANFTKDQGKVFSCFACGGGSTMGYKLAGFDVIGFNEIDPKMAECYISNHNPRYRFIEPIQEFKNRDDLPQELYELDILDGSPPCSSFSMAGNREKDWGKEKKFREGQAEQILDTLFFDFIELAEKLKPKIVVAENVKGLLMGEAKKYVTEILKEFDKAGYAVTYKLLNAAKMGVPQKRERVFFIGIRKDLKYDCADMFGNEPLIDLEFNEKEIAINKFYKTIQKKESQNYSDNRFGDIILNTNKPSNTITTINRYWIDENNLIDDYTIKNIGSYPQDYNFLNNEPKYLIGMSVPPLMTAQIADRINDQILKRNKK